MINSLNYLSFFELMYCLVSLFCEYPHFHVGLAIGIRVTSVETLPDYVETVVIGGGVAGLGLAVKLLQQNNSEFLVLERGPTFGGTWRDNTYPGAACDVPSHLYSYSFEPNPSWSQTFSTQSEILHYIHGVAEKYKVHNNFVFGCTMLSALWDESTATWQIETDRGHISAKILVSAVGALSEPSRPDIDGIEHFAGTMFHSARWDHSFEPTGKNVAVIGTGAAAIQIVPAIAGDVKMLLLFQRSAPWLFPKLLRSYTGVEKRTFRRFPLVQRILRNVHYLTREIYAIILIKVPALIVLLLLVAKVKLLWEIRDATLRDQVTPTYRVGCKRMLISNDYYPSLTRENVEVVGDDIVEIREHSIITRDGTERPVDAIILATGFHVTDSPAFSLITGRGGRTLSEVFESGGIQAYKGSAIAEFPNSLLILGPNSALGYSSAIFMIESQISYIADAIATVKQHDLRTFEVRKDVQDAFNDALQSRLKTSVWVTGGCTSWFLDKRGNNVTLWPDFSIKFRRLLEKFDIDAYTVTRAAQTRPTDAMTANRDRT